MKYLPDNTFLGCYHCHLSWWHKNPIEAYKWYIKHFPLKLRTKLANIIKNYDKLEKPRYEEIKALYSQKTQ